MAQVNGRLRRLTTRLSSDRVPSVKYSTLCPSRSDSPAAAIRAMPTSFGGDSKSGSSGCAVIGAGDIRYLFAYDNSRIDFCQMGIGREGIAFHSQLVLTRLQQLNSKRRESILSWYPIRPQFPAKHSSRFRCEQTH